MTSEDHDPQPQQDPADDEWNKSTNARATRRLALICWLAVAVLAVLAAGYLLQAHVGSHRLSLSSVELDQASDESDEENAAVLVVRNRIEKAQSLLESSEKYPGLYGGVETRKAAAQEIDAARAELPAALSRASQANDRYRAAQREQATARDRNDEMWLVWLLYLGAVGLVAGVVHAVNRHISGERRRDFENRQLVNEIESAGADDDLSLEFPDLWRQNKVQLRLYHQLVLNYATSARRTTQISLISGFVFLLAVGVVATFASDVPSAISSSVVVAAGTVVTGFIANAVLRNADSSSREVTSFFAHPLEVERMLAAERIIATMPEAARPAAQTLIVNALTRAVEVRAPVAENPIDGAQDRTESDQLERGS
ncbi:hypothetical protein [Virgisporangium aurantiacum]|uniref:Uncharacterized protein n=1 Tax=Virgisporangium aurantiacum TaxID=175570 RepID=A0A8J3ZCV6_9ACTN|nr:hypothetical protein [Virgisporangium aurantiacum]GIJ61879.1 hypothetical protein Vau01_093950 [Virgisporangium aurantiacum]